MQIKLQSGARLTPQEQEVTRELRQTREPSQVQAQNRQAPQDLKGLTDRMNEAASALNQSLKFEFSEHHHMLIKIVDTTTNEVIREIPPESLVRAFERMQELMGLLLDKKL